MLEISNDNHQITMKYQMTTTKITNAKAKLLQALEFANWKLEIAATKGAF